MILNPSKNQSEINRRQFARQAALGSLAVASTRGTAQAIPEKDKIKTGLIGCGWYGMVDLNAAFKVGGVDCVALCDVDSEHLKNSADSVEKIQGVRPATFKDYQKLLQVPGLQAVIIATPPQWHALPFIHALDAGLDIYCEKPLAYDIREGQAMVKAAQNSSNVVQIGFQRRQSKAIAAARDYIRQGNIGDVVQADVQIHYTARMLDPTPQNPPASLDWDLWCGPAPKLPYSPQIGHKAWRLEKEYGNGHLVDWGIHLIDAMRWILDETMPRSVQAAGGIYHHKGVITTPDILTAYFDFDTCPVMWRHRLWGAREYDPQISNGIFFYGTRGTVFVSDRRWVVIPKEKKSDPIEHKINTDMGTDHVAEFLTAVRTREQNLCTPRDAYYSTATVQLGMIAYEMKQRIQWDQSQQSIVNNNNAARLMKRPYRSPYTHPFTSH